MKKIFTVLLMLFSISIIAAPPGTQSNFNPDNMQGEISTKKVNPAKKWIKKYGFRKGINNGPYGEIIIQAASAKIQCPLTGDPATYINSRANAYDEAMLLAKSNLAGFLSKKIEKIVKVERNKRTGSMPSETKKDIQKTKKLSIIDKTVLLVNKKLDDKLKAEGIDVNNKEQVEKALKQPAMQKTFKNIIGVTATAEVAAMQSVATFEQDNSIYVVGMISPNTLLLNKALINSLTGGKHINIGKGKPVESYIPTNDIDLLCSFGTKLIRDENGNAAIISYGQAPVEYGEEQDALDDASIEADGFIRSFAGETVSVHKNREKAEQTKIYKDGSNVYKGGAETKKQFESVAESLNISGISELDSFVVKHPLVNCEVAITISLWSPQNAQTANNLRATINNTSNEEKTTQSSEEYEYNRDTNSDKGIAGAGSQGVW